MAIAEKDIFFYYLAYFCYYSVYFYYYSWVLLHFLILFMDLTVLFQLKEIMNLIYVGFSDRQFFVPQDLKFSSDIFLTIFTLISDKYVCISFFLLQTLFECLYPWLTHLKVIECMHLPLSLFPTYQVQEDKDSE